MTVQIDRVEARAKIKPRRDPYWHRLAQGRHVGFRRLTTSSIGTWLARFYDGESYQYNPLGDFAQLGEKQRFDAAKRAGEEWFQHLDRGGSTENVTVREACGRYVEHLMVEKTEAAATDAGARFRRHVDTDPLGAVELARAKRKDFDGWRKRMLKDGTKGSFNRNATALRAAMNLAHDTGLVSSMLAWRAPLKAFRDVDGRRELYLDRDARRSLLKHASAEAQRFIRTLMLLPLRPGDVAKLKVEHFDAKQATLSIPAGKTKRRTIPVSAEAVVHFKACAKDKLPGAWLVSRDDGRAWNKDSWADGIDPAAAAAKLPAATCAYSLRHAVITDLVKGGLDLFTVAKISGTSVAMIERHYGHLQQEHARKALEKLSIG